MKQYYESELIKEIVEARGHEKSSLHYESECIESWVEEAKGAYPKLCDYQSEWLSYINKIDGGGTEQPDPEPPIGEFPYVVLSDVTEATIDNVVPYAYKSAILKGQTIKNLVNEQGFGGSNNLYESRFFNTPINTGEKMTVFVVNPLVSTIRIGFENANNGKWSHETSYDVRTNKRIVCTVPNGKLSQYAGVLVSTPNNSTGYENSLVILKGDYSQLEISSYFDGIKGVENPSLTTTGKNLVPNIKFIYRRMLLEDSGNIIDSMSDDWACDDYLDVPTQKTMYTNMIYIGLKWTKVCFYDENKNFISLSFNDDTINFPENAKYWRVGAYAEPLYGDLFNQVMFCKSLEEAHSTYEPYKTNILTVNEDVTLRSNGGVHDELDLLTGKLTQRIDENGEVLSQESIKTVELNIQDQDGKTLSAIKPIEGKMLLSTSSDTIKPLFSGEIPVEAITQNLSSFIDLEMEE